MTTKQCSKCHQIKDVSEFYKREASDDGLQFRCNDCSQKFNKTHNPNRMYIKGIGYIKKSDIRFKDIWTPGRFKSVLDVATISAVEKVQAGHVYIIYNPAFEGWFKVGCALDANDRLKQYQTSSPFRDYEIAFFESFDDRKAAEKLVHDALKSHPRTLQWFYEWFLTDPSVIRKVILDVKQKEIDARHRDEHGTQYNLGLCN